jgi:hypothetical protein
MSMLIIDGVRYRLWTPTDEEKEFHPLVRKCSKDIFGEDSLYFEVKQILRSASGVGSIPDAYVISLSKSEWYVVENELSSHPVYDHIVNQLTKFINGIENQNARSQIVDILYDEIKKDPVLKATIEKAIRSTEIYHFLSKLLSKNPRIVIIVDEKKREVEEACRVLKYDTHIIELKSFVREDAPSVRAHIFEPLYTAGRVAKIEKREERKHFIPVIKFGRTIKIEKREEGKPKPYKQWDDLLAWVNDNIKELVSILSERIASFGDVNRLVRGRYLCFYRGKPSSKSIFAAFMLTKGALKVRIRTDPNTFSDPQKWTGDRIYKGWFFKQGQEREFKISSKDQIPYAIEIVKHSYEISGLQEKK